MCVERRGLRNLLCRALITRAGGFVVDVRGQTSLLRKQELLTG